MEASGRNHRQSAADRPAAEAAEQLKSIAVGCHRLPFGAHCKEWVDRNECQLTPAVGDSFDHLICGRPSSPPRETTQPANIPREVGGSSRRRPAIAGRRRKKACFLRAGGGLECSDLYRPRYSPRAASVTTQGFTRLLDVRAASPSPHDLVR
jgi:hypothetical protein